MALTPDRITQLIQQADSLAPKEGSIFRALVKLTEAEARAQDTALIRQLVEALESVDGAMPFPVARQVLKVARSRLLDSDLAKLTDRGEATPSTDEPRS